MHLLYTNMLRLTIAKNFWQRLRGLIGRSELGAEEAWLIPHCRQVHTWLMRFPIDVVFIDADGVVLKVIERLRPWRVSPRVPGADACLELLAGTAESQGMRFGQEVLVHY